jgi:molybdopterin-synthase adenylyltransferase
MPYVEMSRPRVKPEHGPFRVADGRIRIGGLSYGVAAEMDDPDRWIWTLLTFMDGSRSAEELVTAVREGHPDISRETIRAGLRQLIRAGHVEDMASAPPASLTDRDLDRYDRSMRFFRWLDVEPRTSCWEPQAMLQAARVTVLGLGGTGGAAAQALTAAGIGKLHIADFDVVELSNLCRQVLYTEDDIGASKVDAALRRLRRLNSDIEITGQHLHAKSADDIAPLLDGCDVFVLAADRPGELRRWANRACLAASTPWVEAGYHGPRTQVGVYVPGKGACWECIRAHTKDRRRAEGADPDAPELHTDAVWNAVGPVSAGISGCVAAHQVISLITGIPEATPGRIDGVNLSVLDAPLLVTDPPHPRCPACGPR